MRATRLRLAILLMAVVAVAALGVRRYLALRDLAAHATDDPEQARLVWDDVLHFAEAHEAISTGAEPVATLRDAYFGQASAGLEDYVQLYGGGPERLAAALVRWPGFYAGLLRMPALISRQESDVRQLYRTLRQLYPPAKFPPVYYVVGHLRVGGFVRPQGLVIGTDIYGWQEDTNLGEFPNGVGAIRPSEQMPYQIAHELIHYQQYARNQLALTSLDDLLSRTINEGAADFLGELISGGHVNSRAHAYGREHEKDLWCRFRSEMTGEDLGDWFFVRPETPDWPQDLGYFMGYQITAAYFARFPDKAAAIDEIIATEDPHLLLVESGYASQFGDCV
ncbi:MAG: hypothetical protein ABFS14_13255 [Gemmatimonadota bacterium]